MASAKSSIDRRRNRLKTVSLAQVGQEELALPPRVQEALGELVGSAKEGLLALSVGVGLGVLAELLEEEVGKVGQKGKHDPERTAVRHGHEAGDVTLSGRRVGIERPRVRSADGRAEVRLQTYEYFADRGSAVTVGAGADARQRLDAALPAHAGAGRRRARAGSAVDVALVGLAHLHRAETGVALRADEPKGRRRAPGGDTTPNAPERLRAFCTEPSFGLTRYLRRSGEAAVS
ncbi:MAG: hypothetical protein MSC30_01290 [Gaiellaceae bacterium MAG52_C11]|nr:hypothetical protein [Candidatus Gaiellasilicea maunaloa]